MSTTLASRYDPKEAQDRWYAFWEQKGYFHAEPDSSRGASGPGSQPYTIVIPPPNVTGALHMGHALNNTLQDILVRWRRMQGYNTLWMPGTDHAGIATQAVVERRIREQEGLTRQQLGRDELVRRIWEWKDEYERRILNQLRKLGCSCDWARTRFTFDEGCSRAVRETFFKMFRDGLIYRGKRLVNWDPQLQTSVADDETYTEEVKGGFWTFKYPVKSSPHAPREESGPAVDVSRQTNADGQTRLPHAEREGYTEYVRFSTTRPETMLGDTAVAVHPNDPRYKHLIGKSVVIPIAGNREIPVIADGLLADPTLGTGCVKVTPAHDPNDYACWQRHQGKPDEIGIINILNPDGTINEAGGKYAGMDRYAARESVTTDMEALGLFDGREDRTIPLKFSDRSKTPIEPLLSDQWFVRMDDRQGSRVEGPGPERGRQKADGEEPEDTPSAKPNLPTQYSVPSTQPTQYSVLSTQHSAGPQPSTFNTQPTGLAEVAMQAVRDGRVKIHPERYAKTYLDWLGEKRDWCISRQLWWGHRIPVWSAIQAEPMQEDPKQRTAKLLSLTAKIAGGERSAAVIRELASMLGPEAMTQAASSAYAKLQEEFPTEIANQVFDGKLFVCLNPSTSNDGLASMIERHGFVQDPDVLDTWFSSQLWPHSTLGWPGLANGGRQPSGCVADRSNQGADAPRSPNEPDWEQMRFYYPTSVLVTSREIITLWVARMVIAGVHNCGEVPFRDVYVTPTILDAFGQRMSKSKGNGVDPLDIIDKYGADALRFTIAQMTTESQDARLPVGYECPFCQTYIAQKIEHQQMKPKAGRGGSGLGAGGSGSGESGSTAGGSEPQSPAPSPQPPLLKPRIKCPSCKKDFQFSSPNFDPDPGEPVARVVSERFEQGRNFANKLWNAARFTLMNLEGYTVTVFSRSGGVVGQFTPAVDTAQLADDERWILSRLAGTIAEVTGHLENFRFSEVAKSLYEFSWSEFCDWYVEMAKLRLKNPETRATAQRVLATVLDHLLRLLHPVMPFVTEQIWQALAEVAPRRGLGTQYSVPSTAPHDLTGGPTNAAPSVMIAPWPTTPANWRNPEVERRMARLQELIKAIRNIRSNFNVDPRTPVAAHVRCSATVAEELRAATAFIEQLATVSAFDAGPNVTKPADSVTAVSTDGELYVPLTGLIDVPAEIERQGKRRESLAAQLKSFQSKLANVDFVSKAPPDVVELHRQRVTELTAQLASVEEILRELGG